jgi:putative transposase
VILSYRYRIDPNRAQTFALSEMLGDFCQLYNADASWGQFVSMIRYKAESAGCEVVEVDPRGTSQTCPECGTVAAKTLAERTHRCDCGCVLDRDVAAAMVVHQRAFGLSPGAGGGLLTWPVAA